MSMRKWLLGAAVIACLAGTGCSADPNAAPTNPAGPTPAPSGTLTIEIAEMNGPNSFYPSPVSVGSGRSVSWHNGDGTTHHVVFDETAIDTGSLAPGTTSQPFSIASGTWHYHCAIHPDMTGAITIVDPGDGEPTPGY